MSGSDKPPPKLIPLPGKLTPPKIRPRSFTLPDDGAVEEARLRSAADTGSDHPQHFKGAVVDVQLPSSEPVSDRLSMGALELADSADGGAGPGPDEQLDAAFQIEVTFGDEEPPERPTEPAPPNYEASAQRAVDGTIPLDASLLAPGIPAEARALLQQMPPPASDRTENLDDLVSLGDYTGALELATRRLDLNPMDREAEQVQEQCRAVLLQMYTARLGPLNRVPVVSVPAEQLRWMSIDQRAAFMIHHIDGFSTLEMILDVSGMPVLDAMRILTELVHQRVITFR